jgi:hypothetical protein
MEVVDRSARSLLGRTHPDRDWNPQDGRIVRLGLHRRVDPEFDRDVSMLVYARPADGTWPELQWLTSMDTDRREAFCLQHQAKLRLRAQRGARPHASPFPAGARIPRPLDPDPTDDGILEFRDDDPPHPRSRPRRRH